MLGQCEGSTEVEGREWEERGQKTRTGNGRREGRGEEGYNGGGKKGGSGDEMRGGRIKREEKKVWEIQHGK